MFEAMAPSHLLRGLDLYPTRWHSLAESAKSYIVHVSEKSSDKLSTKHRFGERIGDIQIPLWMNFGEDVEESDSRFTAMAAFQQGWMNPAIG